MKPFISKMRSIRPLIICKLRTATGRLGHGDRVLKNDRSVHLA
jgi:hypothetical protein